MMQKRSINGRRKTGRLTYTSLLLLCAAAVTMPMPRPVQADLKQTASQWIEKAGHVIPTTIGNLTRRKDKHDQTDKTVSSARGGDVFYEDLPVRDPFKPTVLLAVLKEEERTAQREQQTLVKQAGDSMTPTEPEEEIIPPPEATLQGLIWNTDKPQALVDQRIVQPGDLIQGWLVEKIDDQGVHLRYENRTHLLKPAINFVSERSSP